jgi:hypothetical protein
MQRGFGPVRGLAYRVYVFVYSADNESEPTSDRKPLAFTEVYLGHLDIAGFRKSARGEFGTENPCVGGSIPHLTTIPLRYLRSAIAN